MMSVKRPSITVLGSFVAGMTVRLPRMPVPGESLRADKFDVGPGGKGANLAVAATRLGARVSLIAKVGKDDNGRLAERIFKEEAIADPHLFRTDSDATGVGLVYVDHNGENMIGFYPGANMEMTCEEVDSALKTIEETSLVTAQLEVPNEVVAHAFRWAHRRGIRTLLNPAPARALPREIFELTNVITPNFNEAFAIVGEAIPSCVDVQTVERVARGIQALGPDDVVVTMGKDGVLVLNRDHSVVLVPPIDVEPIDTVGAGDAFNAGLTVALAEGYGLEAAARFGAISGGLATRKLGVIDALPSRSEVDTLLE